MIPAAKKELGQNFLRNPKILETIVGDNNLSGVHVIEIGPGLGDLTEKIFQKHPKSLTLIEIDPAMVHSIISRFHEQSYTVYQTDVLRVDIKKGRTNDAPPGGFVQKKEYVRITMPQYIVYGNIPYYITSPIIHHFLYTVSLPPETLILTMQKEVAERILCRDGSYSVLSIACTLIAHVKKVCDIHPNNFFPVPKVWSTCLCFTLKNVDRKEMKKILAFVQLGFSQKRKKLLSNLAKKHAKEKLISSFQILGIKEDIRAENIPPEMWIKLYRSLTQD